MRRLAAAAVPLALLAAGCSATAATVAATPGPTGPPLDGGTYVNASDMLAALAKAGLPCAGPSPVANATIPGVTSLLDCGLVPGGDNGDTGLMTFDSHEHAQAYAESMTSPSMVAMIGVTVVVFGGNWAVNTTPKYADQVRLALGGSVLSASPSPTS